jgi:hypothetical protein
MGFQVPSICRYTCFAYSCCMVDIPLMCRLYISLVLIPHTPEFSELFHVFITKDNTKSNNSIEGGRILNSLNSSLQETFLLVPEIITLS